MEERCVCRREVCEGRTIWLCENVTMETDVTV